jgi:hypothetical protein
MPWLRDISPIALVSINFSAEMIATIFNSAPKEALIPVLPFATLNGSSLTAFCNVIGKMTDNACKEA